jgi:hypothetical protein
MEPDIIFRRIYDRDISLKEFKKWFEDQLNISYNKGIKDAQEDFNYEDISRSQYD